MMTWEGQSIEEKIASVIRYHKGWIESLSKDVSYSDFRKDPLLRSKIRGHDILIRTMESLLVIPEDPEFEKAMKKGMDALHRVSDKKLLS